MARRHAGANEADDIAQEAALRAWRSRGSCQAPEQPWAWLSTITRREVFRRCAVATCADLADLPEQGTLDRELEALPDRLTVWSAVASLSRRDREIVLMRYEQDMTVAAIADALDLPVGTVKVTLLRIRDKLRARLLS